MLLAVYSEHCSFTAADPCPYRHMTQPGVSRGCRLLSSYEFSFTSALMENTTEKPTSQMQKPEQECESGNAKEVSINRF